MIQTLADVQPILLLTLLIVMYSIESFRPYLAKPANKKQHDIHNFILTFISIVVNAVVGAVVVFTVVYTADHQLGLFNQIKLPSVVEIIASVLLIDFGSYCNHHLLHKIPFLWRFHRVHHSDLNLNTSSSLRFHPFEVIYSQGIYFCVAILLLGVSMTSFVIYGTLGLVFVIIQHSNTKFPDWIEKYGRYIFSTPGWHKIHHSDEQKFTDSHFGDVFTFWDRIFGTWHKVNPDEINYGLKEFDNSEKQTAGFLLRSPFIDVTKVIK
ncbi:MAG: sterol desaturase family protein [Saprospiraceae bacterium]|nr:sterol desaturase family protein [Saprospiraceae bacterium]